MEPGRFTRDDDQDSGDSGPDTRELAILVALRQDPYKRFSRFAQAFSIDQNHTGFVDIDFFNTHACWRQLKSWHLFEGGLFLVCFPARETMEPSSPR